MLGYFLSMINRCFLLLQNHHRWAFQDKVMLNQEDPKSLGQKLFLIERPLRLVTRNCLSIILNYLALTLNSGLSLAGHTITIIVNVNKDIRSLYKFQHVLPQFSSIKICKALVRSHLGYGDIFFA